MDADQYAEAPGYIMTSMVKGVDAAVFDAIKRAQDGKFKGGTDVIATVENTIGPPAQSRTTTAATPMRKNARLRRRRPFVWRDDFAMTSTLHPVQL